MSIGLYADVHVPHAVIVGLRVRGVDVITAQDDGSAELSDHHLLDRAKQLGRVLVSLDQDFLVEGAKRSISGHDFCGIVFARQLGITIGQMVQDLELIAKASDPAEWWGRVEFLPLR